MNKGEIWHIEIPFSDGHEQSGARPAIIIAETQTNVVLVVPFTSNIQALRFPFTIEVKPTEKNGLNAISAALVFQMRAIDKRRLKEKIGEIDNFLIVELNDMLKKLLQL